MISLNLLLKAPTPSHVYSKHGRTCSEGPMVRICVDDSVMVCGEPLCRYSAIGTGKESVWTVTTSCRVCKCSHALGAHAGAPLCTVLTCVFKPSSCEKILRTQYERSYYVPTLTLNFRRNVFFAASARIVLDVVLSETIVLDRASRNPYKIRVFTPTCHNVGYHSNRDTIEPDYHKPITWWSCSHTNQRKPVVYNHFVVKTGIFYRAVIDFSIKQYDTSVTVTIRSSQNDARIWDLCHIAPDRACSLHVHSDQSKYGLFCRGRIDS